MQWYPYLAQELSIPDREERDAPSPGQALSGTTSSTGGVRPCEGCHGEMSPNGNQLRSYPGGDERTQAIRNSHAFDYMFGRRCCYYPISSQA